MFLPPIKISPFVASQNLAIKFIIVLFPAPDSPIRAVTLPSFAIKLILCNTSLLSSYEKETSRSEEHTSELQSRQYLVCRLLLEKKKNYIRTFHLVSATYLNLIQQC